MPGLLNTTGPTGLSAKINFIVPREEIKQPLTNYLRFDVANLPPTTETLIPLHDLREGMDSLPSVEEQMDKSGYAVLTQESSCDLGDALDSVEGTDAYIAEAIATYKKQLGATRVIAWNSVIRSNSPDAGKETVEARQLTPEKGMPPLKQVKATARSAHVDQDEDYARVICKRAAGDDVFEKYSRVQIINLWRPLTGPVTNAPLAIADFTTLDVENDMLIFASAYGTGYGIHYNPDQKWSYIQHQLPSEVIFLRCFDSWQGKDGKALFCPHVACDVLGEPDLGILEVPRTSIELRMVVLHE